MPKENAFPFYYEFSNILILMASNPYSSKFQIYWQVEPSSTHSSIITILCRSTLGSTNRYYTLHLPDEVQCTTATCYTLPWCTFLSIGTVELLPTLHVQLLCDKLPVCPPSAPQVASHVERERACITKQKYPVFCQCSIDSIPHLLIHILKLEAD